MNVSSDGEEQKPAAASPPPHANDGSKNHHLASPLETLVDQASSAPPLLDTQGSGGSNGLRKYDILTGRGSGPNQSHGNTLFRQMVWETYQEYLQSLQCKGESIHPSLHHSQNQDPSVFRRPMDGNMKNLLARRILTKVQDQNGRFLRRICKEDFRNLPEDEKARVVRVAVGVDTAIKAKAAASPSSKTDPKAEESSSSPSSSTSPQTKVNLYVELSVKDTLEKIKQSLRFQVERSDQQPRDAKPPKQHRQPFMQQLSGKSVSRKRLAMEAAMLSSGTRPDSSQPPPKKRAISIGSWGASAADNQFGMSAATATPSPADTMKILPMEIAKKLLEIGPNRPLTGQPSDNGQTNAFMWSLAGSSDTGRSTDATRPRSGSMDSAFSLERLQQLQKDQTQSQTQASSLWSTLMSLKGSEAQANGPPVPSNIRSTTQLEAISRLLLQEKINEELAASIRHQQELQLASSFLESRSTGSAMSSGLGNSTFNSLLWSNPTTASSRALLSATLSMGQAARRQIMPSDGSGIAMDGLKQKAFLTSGLHPVGHAGISETVLQQLYQRLGANSNVNSNATQHSALSPSIIPSLMSSTSAQLPQKTKQESNT